MNVVMAGTVAEVNECTVYVDYEPTPGVEIVLHQPEYAEYMKGRGVDYYAPSIRFNKARVGAIPKPGDQVTILARAIGRRGSGANAHKTYVNFEGRVLEGVKA